MLCLNRWRLKQRHEFRIWAQTEQRTIKPALMYSESVEPSKFMTRHLVGISALFLRRVRCPTAVAPFTCSPLPADWLLFHPWDLCLKTTLRAVQAAMGCDSDAQIDPVGLNEEVCGSLFISNLYNFPGSELFWALYHSLMMPSRNFEIRNTESEATGFCLPTNSATKKQKYIVTYQVQGKWLAAVDEIKLQPLCRDQSCFGRGFAFNRRHSIREGNG